MHRSIGAVTTASHRHPPRRGVGIVRRMPIRRHCPAALACVLFMATGACANIAPRCATGEQAVVDERLYFGTQRPGGEVSGPEWADFVEHAIAAGFPDGFTTWPAQGQWRNEDGQAVREASHVLAVVHRDDSAGEPSSRKVHNRLRAPSKFERSSCP